MKGVLVTAPFHLVTAMAPIRCAGHAVTVKAVKGLDARAIQKPKKTIGMAIIDEDVEP